MAARVLYIDKLRRVRQLGDPSLDTISNEQEEVEQWIMIDTMSLLLDRQDNCEGRLHPTKALLGEQLSKGFSHSYVGFLLCDHQREVIVDQHIVQ